MILPTTIETDRGLSVAGAGPDLLDDLLAEYERVVTDRGLPFHELMGDGLARADVIAGFASIGITPPEELVRWFTWHNPLGNTPHGHTLFPRLEPVPFALAFGWHHQYVEIGYHPSEWFAFVGDHNGIAVACNDEPSPPRVHGLDKDEGGLNLEDPRTSVVSLCTPVTWWLEMIDHYDAWWTGDATEWEVTRARFLSIPERLRQTGLM